MFNKSVLGYGTIGATGFVLAFTRNVRNHNCTHSFECSRINSSPPCVHVAFHSCLGVYWSCSHGEVCKCVQLCCDAGRRKHVSMYLQLTFVCNYYHLIFTQRFMHTFGVHWPCALEEICKCVQLRCDAGRRKHVSSSLQLTSACNYHHLLST